MNAHDQQSGGLDGIIFGIFGALVLLFGIGVWYATYKAQINEPFIIYTHLLSEFWLLFPLPEHFRSELLLIQHFIVTRQPSQMSWQQVSTMANIASEPFRWISIPIFLGMGALAWRGIGQVNRLRNVYKLREMMALIAEKYPAIMPAVKFDLLKAPRDVGPWASPYRPLEFAHLNKLLYRETEKGRVEITYKDLFVKKGKYRWFVNYRSPILKRKEVREQVRFDHDACKAVFIKQLGARFTNFKSLPPYAKALATAFIAHGYGDKKEAQAILDQLSRSFDWDDKEKRFVIDATGYESIISKYARRTEFAEFNNHHRSFVNVWMTSALEWARRKGRVPSSQFIWLRVIDRTMFSALNQLGGRRPWAEATGVWAHYEAEEEVETSLLDPELEDSTEWIEDELYHSGWLDLDIEEEEAA